MDIEEITRRMSAASSVVKLVCGVGNNAAWLVMLDAMDHARSCARFRGPAKKEFNRCVQLFHEYEGALVYARVNRFFHVPDMADHVRKKYGQITDREYYDFWASTGAAAYQATRPMVTSLVNKYRLSLISHGVRDAAHVAWVMAAMAALELSVRMYDSAIREIIKGYSLPENIVRKVFGQFSLKHIAKKWGDAMVALSPDSDYPLQDSEKRNIELGLDQLFEAWMSLDTMYDSVSDTVEDYGEVFRTKGEQKKAMREIADIKADTVGELMEKRNYERRDRQHPAGNTDR